MNFYCIGIIVCKCQHLLRRSVEKFERFQIVTLPVADVVAIATVLTVTVCFPLSRYLFLISWPNSNVQLLSLYVSRAASLFSKCIISRSPLEYTCFEIRRLPFLIRLSYLQEYVFIADVFRLLLWGNRITDKQYVTHGVESFLSSRQLCSYSRTSQNFM
jgi:hypothetical protein